MPIISTTLFRKQALKCILIIIKWSVGTTAASTIQIIIVILQDDFKSIAGFHKYSMYYSQLVSWGAPSRSCEWYRCLWGRWWAACFSNLGPWNTVSKVTAFPLTDRSIHSIQQEAKLMLTWPLQFSVKISRVELNDRLYCLCASNHWKFHIDQQECHLLSISYSKGGIYFWVRIKDLLKQLI